MFVNCGRSAFNIPFLMFKLLALNLAARAVFLED